ncbi:MAG: HAD-IIB family hydrolase [Mariprofundales bacterium]|nr:HAD-IIB family hydrolase [Mariprofundales bacterium]
MNLLLCTDLDRTLIPNGDHPESPSARELFSRFVRSSSVRLAYVSGRHRALISEAIRAYHLPMPDFAIADVGSTIYRIDHGVWQQWSAWDAAIASDWQGLSTQNLHALLSEITPLQLQEPEKQNTHKLSYYLPFGHDHQTVIRDIETRLKAENIRANLIWSVDAPRHIGLLDILPASANKLHAINFLMQHEGYDNTDTVFAGDSGNDLDVLQSPIPSVLVANADDAVRASILAASPEKLYPARGDFLGMNGCYSAGILEGIAHYWPEYAPLIAGLR